MYQSSHYTACMYNSCSHRSDSGLESITKEYRSEKIFHSADYSKDHSTVSYSARSFTSRSAAFLSKAFYQTPATQMFPKTQPSYSQNSFAYNLFKLQPEYHFIPDDFLRPGKAGTFVGKAGEVKEFVEEAFEKIFLQSFPNDIKISVLNEKEFRKIAPSLNTVGLSINRSEYGLLSEIFVLNDSLGKVMLTIGHELGHVLSPSLGSTHDEEAKAYAFSLVWVKTIKEHDIAGLGEALILEHPAENGLHNVAFSFVHKLVKQGTNAWNVYLQLIQKGISMDCLS